MASRSLGALPIAGGVTLAAFASGFGVCLFNLDTVGQCLTLAHSWIDIFRDFGNQVYAWAIAMYQGALAYKQ
jgi:hypothetical protein